MTPPWAQTGNSFTGLTLDLANRDIASELFDALEEASQSIFYVIQDGSFVWGNRHGCRITGLDSLKDVIGKPALTFVHPDDKPLITRMSRKVMKGESIQPFEWRLRTVDGQVVWVLGFLMKIQFKGRPALLGNYIDVTQAKQTRLELQSTYQRLEDLTRDLKSVREEERAQIAWELQENLGHTLNSLKTGLTDLFSGREPDSREKETMLGKVEAALDALARISSHLAPPETNRGDLFSAVRRYAHEFGEQTGIVLNAKIPRGSMELEHKTTSAVFRIFQEMLKTLAGLGQFKKIDLILEWDLSKLKLELTGPVDELKSTLDISDVRRAFRYLSVRIEEWNGELNIEKKRKRLSLAAEFNLASSPGAHETRILFGCAQPILMEGVQQVLLGLPRFIMAGRAETWLELLEKANQPDFDLLLVDTVLLGGRLTDNLKKLKDASPDLPILALHSQGEDDDLAVRLLRQGASGYLSRSSSPNELVAAIQKVAGGRKHINNRLAEKLAFEVDVYSPKPFHHRLSDRERQVMFMIAEGKTMKEIAEVLCLSYKTIATYRNRVLEKMNMKNDNEIVRYVVSKGLV